MIRAPRRVLVIGAGHNGLVAALRLADAGLEVTVLEQADRPGGALKSAQDTLPGFVHDRCAGFLPLTVASTAFEGLGVRERIDWIQPPVAMAHPFLDAPRSHCIATSARPARAWRPAHLARGVPGTRKWRRSCGVARR